MLALFLALFIHLFVPLAGVAGYCAIVRRMLREYVERPPWGELLCLFFTYGGWLMMLLTVTFWRLSGAALVGLGYLVLVAPLIMGAIVLRLADRRMWSRYHEAAYTASLVYLPFVVVVLPSVFVLALLLRPR